MSILSNFLSFVQISCAGSRIFSLCLLSLVVVHYYIETCRRAYIRTILGTLPSIRGLGRRASGSVRTGVISSCRPSCPTADPAEKKTTVGLVLQVRLCQSRTMFLPRLARTGVRPISTKISFLYGTEMKQ
jgi:hypothetical protein